MKSIEPEDQAPRNETLSRASVVSVAMAVLSTFLFCVLMGFGPILPTIPKYLFFIGMILASFIGAGLGAVGAAMNTDPEKKGFSFLGIFLNAGVFLFLTLYTWSGHSLLE